MIRITIYGGEFKPLTIEYKCDRCGYSNCKQPERLNPEDSKYYYVCLEANDLTTTWNKVFETNLKTEAQEWVDQTPLSRTWHEKIRICDSPNTTNK